MNKDYFLLQNLYYLLDKGYGLEETLYILKSIMNHPTIDYFIEGLLEGHELSELISTSSLPKDFLNYYNFFKNRFTLSKAIENSLKLSQNITNIKNRFIKQMTYPLILLVFLFFFSLFAVLILFPKVNELFLSFSIEQSLLFQILFFLMRFIPFLILFIFIISLLLIIRLIFAINRKQFLVIEQYMKIPFIKDIIKKYFTLKFSIYFNELLKDHLDANTIISILNDSMNTSDMKLIVYEIYIRINEGEDFIEIIEDLPYIDHLFITMYKVYITHPQEVSNLDEYIHINSDLIQTKINQFIHIFVPCVYAFVAFFVIVIYIAIILPMMNIIGSI